jgi:hypothetical protein
MGVWALALTLATTTIVVFFQISPLSNQWKISLFSSLFIKLIPFLLLALISGLFCFKTILDIKPARRISASRSSFRVFICFLIQLILIASGVFAAHQTWEQMTLVSAIDDTLERIDDKDIDNLVVSWHDVSKLYRKEGLDHGFSTSRSVGGKQFEGPGKKIHEDFLVIFLSLINEKDISLYYQAYNKINEWLRTKDLKKLDNYLQHELLAYCFRVLRAQTTDCPPELFKTRLYYLVKIVNTLGKQGANLTWANVGNPVWFTIEEYSKKVGMVSALEAATPALYIILRQDLKNKEVFSLLLRNISNCVPAILAEYPLQQYYHPGELKVVYHLERLLDWYLTPFPDGTFVAYNPEMNRDIKYLLGRIHNMYYLIHNRFGKNKIRTYVGRDIRTWIILRLRGVQKRFKNHVISSDIDETKENGASEVSEVLNGLIARLIRVTPFPDELDDW